ncbi:hypothetical protein LSTR_LSTR006287 [Laodelphax striatellus]|uniref:DUF4485 domain-containing protein n=1 Tax=Laodelphax striatellus TaxID=195883 RepID=A0A482X5C7_LAOST|nr:hypothetical protein LSTR_LSTR006287 [Laodelphax striatellus]
MSESVEDLDYDCIYNMFLTKIILKNLASIPDRQRVLRWTRKLTTCNRTLEERKLRNDFMYYLTLNVQSGELRPPFTEDPPAGPLPAMAQLLPGGAEATAEALEMEAKRGCWGEDVDGASGERPMLVRMSPDGGAFLAAQPIPKCGAFCYLAVVSNKKDE